jgi:hypothetical protein
MDWKQFARQILADLSRMRPSDEVAWTNLADKLASSGVEEVREKRSEFSSEEDKIKYVLGQILFQLTKGSYQQLMLANESLEAKLHGER